MPHTPKKSILKATCNDDQLTCSVDETTPRPRKRESGTEITYRLDEPNRSSQSIPRLAGTAGTENTSSSTSKDARCEYFPRHLLLLIRCSQDLDFFAHISRANREKVTQIPQDFKFDFEAKIVMTEATLTSANQNQAPSLSETLRMNTANGAAPHIRPRSSASQVSTHWESCSEGDQRAVPVTRTSEPTAPSASVEPLSRVDAALEAQSQDKKTQASCGNKKGVRLGSPSLNSSSHIQGGDLPTPTPQGSSTFPTKQTAVSAICERSSRSYTFNSDSLPQGLQFSGGPQREQSNDSSSKATPSHTQGGKTAVTGVVERERREYVLSGSDVLQTKGTTAPAVPERSSRSYTFNSESVPRSFQFSGVAQGEHPKEPSFKASSSRTTNTKASTSCAQQSSSSSSHTRVKPSPWKADKATAKQIRKGRLIVEPPGESPKPFSFWWCVVLLCQWLLYYPKAAFLPSPQKLPPAHQETSTSKGTIWSNAANLLEVDRSPEVPQGTQ